MTETRPYQHWFLTTEQDGLAWLYFDRANKTANTIDAQVLAELAKILQELKANLPKAVLIASAKPQGFIFGADIYYLAQLPDSAQASAFVEQGQQVLQELADFPVPTIAVIKGPCLGGGLELALACHYRIAEEETTEFALPEVKLGIMPGWGGTVRLGRIGNPLTALDMMLTGKTIKAKKAKACGFIDEAVPLRHLKRAAQYYALNRPPLRRAAWWQRWLNSEVIRPIIAKKVRNRLLAKIKPAHYPAPFAILDKWERDGVSDQLAITDEVNEIQQLLQGDTAKNLMRVFLLREQLKSLAKASEFSPQHVHVIGAGVMGGDIAAWCALQGLTVSLQDQNLESIGRAMQRAAQLFMKKCANKRAVVAVMDRLRPDLLGNGVARADIIIEAIFEDVLAKQFLFQQLEKQAKPTALLATNTSSILLEKIAEAMADPSRLVGIHFFNPVAQMPLVEVVAGKGTQPILVKHALAFVKNIGRLPLPVKSSPGFLVNRLLMPYMMAAMAMLEEGLPPEQIDQAAEDFGMPMGPIELADTVGLDVCLAVAQNLSQYYGGTVPAQLTEKVAQKHLGRKTGQGFYPYRVGKIVKAKQLLEPAVEPQIIDRLLDKLLHEAEACLQEGVVANADLLDAGIIFGAGFAPFRGGLLHYAKNHPIKLLSEEPV